MLDWISQEVLTVRRKAFLFVAGNIVPSLILMGSANNASLEVTWQSGALRDFAALVFSAKCGWVFYPFFVYAIACFSLALIRPQIASQTKLISFGIFTGLLLTIHNCVLLCIIIGDMQRWNSSRTLLSVGVGLPVAGIVANILPWLIIRIYRVCYRAIKKLCESRWAFTIAAICIPIAALTIGTWMGSDSVGWAVIGLISPIAVALCCTPFWAVYAYFAMSLRMLWLKNKRFRFRLVDLTGSFLWIGAYLAAWRYAIDQAVVTYASLPKVPPTNCYIATTAARGHCRIVRSAVITCVDGECRVVSAQLRVLKCAEVAMETGCPALHRAIRRIYDTWGPRCARRLRHPLAADVAYILLKPVEWLAWITLRWLAPQSLRMIPTLYLDGSQRDAERGASPMYDGSPRPSGA